MSAIWKINGVTFESLGLSGLKRQLRSLAPDVVTFVASGTAYDAADLSGLAIGDDVVITHTVGATTTQWFTGKVTLVPRVGAPEGEALQYTVTGPWWYLDNLIYRQNFPLDPTTNPGVASPSTHRRAAAVIGQGPTGARETTQAAQTDILDWCIASGAEFSRGSLPTGYYVPYIGITAPTCAEALRSSLKWMPDAASRFDYTATTPVFSVVRRGDATATTIDLAAAPGLKAISITPRPDLKVDHVVIQAVSVSSTNTIVVDEDVDPVGSTGREFGSIVIPIPAASGDVLFSGLAANWRSALSTLQYQGRLTFEEEDCLRTLRPGDVINLTNGVTAWATMRAQIAAVNEDIDAGLTEYELGPPEHLNVQDLIETVMASRWQNTGLLGGATLAGFRNSANSGVEDPSLDASGLSGASFSAGFFSGDVQILGNLYVAQDATIDGAFTAATATVGDWDVGATLDDHETRLIAAETAITALDTREGGHYDELVAADTALDGRIDTAVADLLATIDTVNSHSTAITALDGRLTTVETDLGATETSLAALDTRESGHYTTLTAADTALDDRIDTAVADLLTTINTVNEHSTAITAIDDRLTIAESAVTDQETRLATLETLLSGKTTVTLTVCDSGVTKTTNVVGTTPA